MDAVKFLNIIRYLHKNAQCHICPFRDICNDEDAVDFDKLRDRQIESGVADIEQWEKENPKWMLLNF